MFPSAEQAAIIEHQEGAALVLAPVGAGKTRVMAARLARAMQAGVEAERALCVTFTSRAAAEMRRRTAEWGAVRPHRVMIATFHALCAHLLRSEASRVGIPRDFVVYDEEDGVEILGLLAPHATKRDLRGVMRRIADAKATLDPQYLTLDAPPCLVDLAEEERRWARQYQDVLRARHAVDFGDLILLVRTLLACDEEVRAAWGRRFAWIQVDEVQDTHASEYEVICHLARDAGSLAFFGDLDQSIYGWRGSDSEAVVRRFLQDFAPVRRFALTENRRSTRTLLAVADRFAATFATRHTAICPAADLEEGPAPVTRCLPTSGDEAHWVATCIARLQGHGGRDGGDGGPPAGRGSVAVLTRTNARCAAIAAALEQHGVPHVTAEDLQFFRRAEVKDILGLARLVLNPHDGGALRRALTAGPLVVDPEAIREVTRAQGAGLRLADLAKSATLLGGDPFGPVLQALERGTVVVMDVETTGLSFDHDEVVEVAAVRVTAGAPSPQEFHRYLRPTRSVGESLHVHGLTDEMLRAEGQDAATALAQLAEFVGGAHVVGHNVAFDLRMLRAHARRVGLELPAWPWDDTLEMARRLVPAPRYDLQALARLLEIPPQPAHRALGDSWTTLGLLQALHARLTQGAETRREVVRRVGEHFMTLARRLDGWREAAEHARPPALLARIVDESAWGRPPFGTPARLEVMGRLQQAWEASDDAAQSPREALEALVQQAALSRTTDLLDPGDGRVPVLTVHSAKGLEFDTVFVAGVARDEFPGYRSANSPAQLEEERRLFYVAITRARRNLVLTAFERDNGCARGPSPFIGDALGG